MNKKKITPALLSGMMTISMGTTPISVFAQEEQPQEINETNVEQVNEPVSTEETEITVNTNRDSRDTLTEQPKESEESNDNSNTKTTTSTETNKEIVQENTVNPLAENVTSVTTDGVTTYYASFKEALDFANGKTATVTLLQNTTITDNIDITGGRITFDGNNYEVTYEGGAGLTIQGNDTVFIAQNMNYRDGIMGINVYGATFILESGYILYINSIYDGGTVIINGGTIDYINNYGGTVKHKSPTPSIAVASVNAGSVTVKHLDNADYYGGAEYKLTNQTGTVIYDWQESNKFFNLSSNTVYKVYAHYKGNDTYIQSEAGSIAVTTLKDGSTLIEEPSDLTATYEQKLSDITLPTGWTWVNGDTSLSVGTQTYTAHFDTTSYEDEYDFSAVDGYIKDNHYIERNLTVDISKANTTLTIATDNMDKAYDGNPVAEPSVNKTGSTKEVTFTWYIEDGDNWTELSSAPKDTGSYKLVASVEADENYNEAEAEKEFSISQTTNEWTEELSIIGWTYGKQANEPTAKAKFGSVTYSYSNKNDGTYTEEVPTDVGTWYVKAMVTGNENYTGLEAIQEFTISKADSFIAFKDDFSLGKTYDAEKVVVTTENVETTGSKGNVSFIYEKKVNETTWEKLLEAPINAGTYQVTAYLEGDMNYNAAQSEPLEFTISKAETSLEIKSNLTQSYNGQPVSNPEVEKSGSSKEVTIAWYEKDGNNWKELISAPTDAGTYKVEVHVDEDENYNSAKAVKEFSISQTTNEWTEELSITDWTHGEQANEPTATSKFGTVTFSYSDKEDGTYTDTAPTDAGTWYVKATVTGNQNYTGLEAIQEFTISKANSSIAFKDGFSLDKTYDTKAVVVTADAVETAGSKGNISFSYEKKVGDTWEPLSEAPTGAGTYRVTATLEEDTNYNSATSQLEFTIGKADTVIEFTVENLNKVYDGKAASAPTKQSGNSNVRVLRWYQINEDGTETPLSSAPINAGKYRVVATVEADDNFYGAGIEKTFEITKAAPNYTLPSGLTMKQGDTLSSVALPEGFTWKDGTQKADTLGTQMFKATFTPTDTTNYQTVDVDVTVDVVPATTPVNQPPVINAKDQTLTVGDKFDPMKGVTATDKEDGDLTDKIVITKNTVDTSKAGKYTIDYEVTDNGGTRVRKTIVVTVKEKATTSDEENKSDTDKKTPSKDTAQTSTQTNVLAWTLLGLASAGAFITGLFKRKQQ